MVKVFIDGKEGTTGLQLANRLGGHPEVELLMIDETQRKHVGERRKLINESDVTFLCLPDEAARESVGLVNPGNTHTKILDASTAHRVAPGWTYGFPELSQKQRESIETAQRVAVPGCYATGFISLVAPLVQQGIIAPFHPVTSYAVSGYSGAGKKAIVEYEAESLPENLRSPRAYALPLVHKHLPEMTHYSGLSYQPLFAPMVDNYYSGMLVFVPLHVRALAKRVGRREVWEALNNHYMASSKGFVRVAPYDAMEQSFEKGGIEKGFLAANTLSGTNFLQIYVLGNDEQVLLVARLDNLGKGASGAAVQCMNIMLGLDEKTGLID